MHKEGMSSALQEDLLTLLCHDKQRASIIRSTVDTDYFEGDYRTVAVAVYAHLDQFKRPPSAHLDNLFETILEKKDRKARHLRQLLGAIRAHRKTVDADFVMTKLGNFVRRQKLKSATIEVVDIFETGRLDDEALAQIENIFNRATKERLAAFDPGVFLGDSKRALQFLDPKDDDVFDTGIKELDQLGLGPSRKTLHLFIGLPKRGKCLPSTELIQLADGRCVSLGTVIEKKERNILSLDEDSGLFVPATVTNFWDNGLQECVEVVDNTRRKVTVTTNHPFLTPSGWREISQLAKGDLIAVPVKLPEGQGSNLSDSEIKVVAYLLADGGLNGTVPQFTKHDPEVQQDFVSQIEQIGDHVTWYKDGVSCCIVTNKKQKRKHNKNKTKTLLKTLGICNKVAKTKFVPEEIFKCDNRQLAIFLQTYFSCDGSIYKTKNRYAIEVGSASERLARDLQHLLLRFGIVAKFRQRKVKLHSKSFTGHSVSIRDIDQVLKFINTIGFSYRKGKIAAEAKQILGTLNGKGPYRLRKVANSDFWWSPIRSVKSVGKLQTYDLTVKQHHNFVANSMLVHNTWWLVNLGKNAFRTGRKVLHITLEMGEQQVARRYYQALFALAKRPPKEGEKFRRARFRIDEDGRLDKLAERRFTPRHTLVDDDISTYLDKRLKRIGNRLNRIVIKEFPTGQLTIPMLKAYLQNLEYQHGFIPDLLLVDYPQLMQFDPKNQRTEIGRINKELRGIAGENNIGVAVVSQSHRKGLSARQLDIGNIGEDFSQVATADVICTYSQSPEERLLGLARIFVAGGREEEDQFAILISQHYATGQFCRESIRMRRHYWDMIDSSVERREREEMEEDEEEDND